LHESSYVIVLQGQYRRGGKQMDCCPVLGWTLPRSTWEFGRVVMDQFCIFTVVVAVYSYQNSQFSVLKGQILLYVIKLWGRPKNSALHGALGY
jgi:hypothetical protein